MESFGCRLMLCLLIVHGILKGFVGGGGNAGLIGVPIDFLLREFGVPAATLQIYKGAVFIPWSIKPLLGLASDALPVMGYHRNPYFLLTAIGGCSACAIIFSVPSLPLSALLFLLFCIAMQISFSDLLAEAIYSARLREVPEKGPDLISFVWGAIGVGKLFGVSIVGPMISSLGPRGPYVLAGPLAALAVLIPALNLGQEQPSRDQKRCARVLGAETPLMVVALLEGFGALGLALLSVLGGSLQVKVMAAGALAVFVLALVSIVINPVIAKVNAFFFIQHLCVFSVDGASFYFFTDTPSQYPEGPHFSTTFYTSVLGLVSTFASLFGMFAYTRWMCDWSYPKVLVVGSLLNSAVGILSALVFLRWNLLLGIDDHFFVLASGAIQTVVFEMSWLPGILIISQLCPEGREATMFALLAGSANLGMNLGGYFGALLLHLLGVEPSGAEAESAQFDRLWVAALVSAVGPCLPLVLLRYLIPDVSQRGRIDNLQSSTENSLLQTCMGWEPKAPPSAEFRHIVGNQDSSEELPTPSTSSVELCAFKEQRLDPA